VQKLWMKFRTWMTVGTWPNQETTKILMESNDRYRYKK
jgi:hypothetical protein